MLRKNQKRVFVPGVYGTPARAAYTVCTPAAPGGGSGGKGGSGGTGNSSCKTTCVPYQDDSIAMGQPVNKINYSCQTICTSG